MFPVERGWIHELFHFKVENSRKGLFKTLFLMLYRYQAMKSGLISSTVGILLSTPINLRKIWRRVISALKYNWTTCKNTFRITYNFMKFNQKKPSWIFHLCFLYFIWQHSMKPFWYVDIQNWQTFFQIHIFDLSLKNCFYIKY